jgi:predicted RNA binding protein YcfA (HicA-like mRNA interferase family)
MKKRWKVKELIEIVEADGWYFVRMKGDHRHFHHPVKTGNTTIPGKLSSVLDPFVSDSIFKQAGISKEFIQKYFL